jgi:hypothetical protein
MESSSPPLQNLGEGVLNFFSHFLSDDWDVFYMLNQPPISMISQREMLLFRKMKKVDDGYDVVCKSTTHDDHPINDDVVRATVLAQNIRIRKNKDDSKKTDIVFLNQINCNKIMRINVSG